MRTPHAFSPAEILETIGHAVIVTSIEREILGWNAAAEVLFGWTAEEAVGQRAGEIGLSTTVADDERIVKTLAAGRAWSGDYLAQRKDGSTVLVHATSAPIRNERGEVVAVVSASHDVSQRRLSEAALHEDRQRLRAAFETARMGSWSWDLATGAVEWDEAMEARYGLRTGSFGGTFDEFVERVHPDDREWVVREVTIARDSARDLAFEHRVVWPDGSIHWLEARGRPVSEDDGTLVGMVGVGIDIDERKQLEALMLEASELRATAQVVRQLQEAERIARLASWRWDSETNMVMLSASMAGMLGTSMTIDADAFARALERLTHPDDVDKVASAARDALTSRQRRYVMECRFVFDGDVRVMMHRGEVVADGDRIVEVRGTFQDVTEQRRSEEALLTAREHLARERRAVEVLHETLIRPTFPVDTGFDFAARYVAAEHEAEIGGDWYDAFETPDGDIVFGVGDVSGHGVSSARLMAKLRHTTRAYACIDDDLTRMLTWLDRFLIQFRDDDSQIATLLIGRVNVVTGEVTLVSAGHPPALLVDEDDSRFLDLEPGPPLGSGTTTSDAYSATRTVLEPGTTIVLYTDGLVERRGETIDVGLERLQEAARGHAGDDPEALSDVVIEACLSQRTRDDDVCILSVRRAAHRERVSDIRPNRDARVSAAE